MGLAALLLPRYAAGALPRFLARRVEAALATDPGLAAAYDTLRRAERAATGHLGLGAAQRDRMLDALLDGAPDPTARRASPTAAWALAGPALAGLAVAAFFVVRTPTNGFALGDLAARGSRIAADPVGVKVTCLDAAGHEKLASATAGARKTADVLRCPAASLLAFSTTNLAKETRHVFVVGVDADGTRRFFAPFARDTAAVVVPPGVVDDVLPALARTTPARVSLFVLVSDAPFTGDDIERALSAGARSGIPLGRLDKLPVDVPLQARIDVVP